MFDNFACHRELAKKFYFCKNKQEQIQYEFISYHKIIARFAEELFDKIFTLYYGAHNECHQLIPDMKIGDFEIGRLICLQKKIC
jgi:hypothetical protein